MAVNWLSREVRVIWLSESVEKERSEAEFFFNRRRQSNQPIWTTKSIHIEFYVSLNQKEGFIGLIPQHLRNAAALSEMFNVCENQEEGLYKVNTKLFY